MTDLHTQLSDLLCAVAATLGEPAAGAPIERPRHAEHGDYASSLALRMAKSLGLPPREVAARLAQAAAAHPAVATTTIAGPGFVNLGLTLEARCAIVTEAQVAGTNFGRQPASGERFLLEFVSANPTGPLHIGHGRAAATGDSLARILRHTGVYVDTEYYLNDRGLQVDVLAASLWLRVLQKRGQLGADLPPGAYLGDYLVTVADDFVAAYPEVASVPLHLEGLPPAADASARELAVRARASIGTDFACVREYAVTAMKERIKSELASCKVSFDRWFSEAELTASGAVDAMLADFAQRDLTYAKEGATWFRASKFGDEKDWVVVRSTGEQTYFAADIAYHRDKCERCPAPGVLYLLLGADHHGYVARLRAILAAIGEDPARLEVGLLQLVALVNSGNRSKMSTRSGNFHSLQELISTIGPDAVRLSFVLSKIDVALEFDVDRAVRQSLDNPVYYLQYAHARSSSLLAKWGGDETELTVTPAALADEAAAAVMAELRWFAPTVAVAARERAPHRVAHWLIALAGALHSYYDKVPVLGGDTAGRPSRLALVVATRNALATGLNLLGVEAPTRM